MTLPTLTNRSQTLADLALVAAMAFLIAGLCLALAWTAPLDFTPPRPR